MPELQNILEQYGKQYKEKLDFCKEIEDLKIVEEFDKFISSLYAKDWIVYCKPPFKNANSVIEYLGRYTHRVAISKLGRRTLCLFY